MNDKPELATTICDRISSREIVMIKYLAAAASVLFILAATWPAGSEAQEMPLERTFPSSVGEVVFRHQMHIQDFGVACEACHHSINAKKLNTPHPDYLKSASTKCELCHDESKRINQKPYVCSECHRPNPMNIADETLSAKVVIHKQCWKCHPVGTGKEASAICEKCHSGKKTF